MGALLERKFIGRDSELETLNLLLQKRSASLVVIRGRRRVGKSRLIEEFGKAGPCYMISGLPPSAGTTKQEQLNAFSAQLTQLFDLPHIELSSWHEAFLFLAKLTKKGRHIIALDEISWMGSKDPDFLGWLKTAWDQQFSHNPQLVLIICGSVSSWIERNILRSTGFVGRISIDLHLKEMPLRDAAKFWNSHRDRISPHEILKVLSITGGIPRYLEEVDPRRSAEDNIVSMSFNPNGLLYREFDQIFSDLFTYRADSYKEVVCELVNGQRTLQEIAERLGKAESTISESISLLIQAGFVSKDTTWNLRTGKASNLVKFRLSDNYLRFYLKFIEPHKLQIEQGTPQQQSITTLPGWNTVMGLQFENLVVGNLLNLLPLLRIERSDCVMAGPYFQRPTTRRKGCQVDLLIQTRHRTVYLCEVKFSGERIGMDAVEEIQQKRQRLDTPKGWSIRTALVHVNGVTSTLIQSQAFDYVIDLSDLL